MLSYDADAAGEQGTLSALGQLVESVFLSGLPASGLHCREVGVDHG